MAAGVPRPECFNLVIEGRHDLFTRPVRQLAGVHRVSPDWVGESCRVEFEFDTSQLAFLDKGLTSVTLEVLPESSAAIALYRSVGFTESAIRRCRR